MKKYRYYYLLILVSVLSIMLQSCLGFGDKNSQFQTTHGVGINSSDQAIFKGKLYFTLDRNLYVLDGQKRLSQLTHGMDVRDPAVSPNGKWIAFIVRTKYYSDLVYRSTDIQDQTIHTVVSGNGQYIPDSEGGNDYYWFAQPSWSPDSTHLLFLSDLQKAFYWRQLGGVFTSYFLDMQVFSLPINAPALTAKQAIDTAQLIAYANFGDGGDRDPSYRPNHPGQVIYTHYSYDASQVKQNVQLYLEDANLVKGDNGQRYHPGITTGTNVDPAVALTPDGGDTMNIQPSFSPDGNALLYVRRDDATHMSLYTMPVANNVTSDPTNPAVMKQALEPYNKSVKLLTQQYVGQPIWSPDGKQIAYIGYTNTTFDIWLATLTQDAGTGAYHLQQDSQIRLTDAQGHLDADSRPCWTS